MRSEFPTLQTARLWLRELTADDAPALFRIHSDREAMRWFGTDPLTDVAQAEAMIAGFARARELAQPGTRWGLARIEDGQLIGSCGLFRWNRQWQACGVGYELAPEAWGQGLMREALQAVLGWGFEAQALHRIEAQVHPQNAASIQLLQRLGFQQEGLLREAGQWLGERRDLAVFGLLKRELR